MDHDGSITIDDVEKVMNSLQHLKNEIEMPSVSQIKLAFDKFDTNSKHFVKHLNLNSKLKLTIFF